MLMPIGTLPSQPQRIIVVAAGATDPTPKGDPFPICTQCQSSPFNS